MKKYAEYIKIITLVVVFVGMAAYVKAWTGPTMSPPNGNVAAPLNSSSSTQSKLGSLILNAGTPIQNAIGLTVFGSLMVVDGNQGSGKVLTSDASGNASWQTASVGGSGLNAIQTFTSSGSWTAPAGVTKADVKVWGAGGGGGSAGNCSGAGAGGGGGGFAESIVTVVPGTAYTITIGAGGTAGTSGNNNATAGGNSSFSTLVTANGGALGPNDCNATIAFTAGGSASGDISITGGEGGVGGGFSDGGSGGHGGSSPEGGQGGVGRANNSTNGYGSPGIVPGGAGAGGNGTSPGGAGAGGMVVIKY